MIIDTLLNLPPSKNKRRIMVRGKPFQTPAVKVYRKEVAYTLLKYKDKLPDNMKIVLDCCWYKTRSTQDVTNFHDELCDAIAPALGLNDRWFLVRDIDFVVAKKTHEDYGKVWLQIYALNGVDDGSC